MIRLLLPGLLLSLLGASPALGVRPSAQELAAIHRNPDADAFYKSRPDFFHFATPADLPSDLVWSDGSAQKPFADPNARPGGTLRLFYPSFPPTLRNIGQGANSGFRFYHYDSVICGLVHLHPDTLGDHPALAVQWARSADKKTAFYRLDPDARFSDGQPLTADDYLFAVFFDLHKWVDEPFQQNFYSDYVSGITRYDDYTIAIHTPMVRPDPVQWAAIRPRPRNFYRGFNKDYLKEYNWKFEPTTGAYEILPSGVKHGQSIELTKVKNFWAQDKPFFKYRNNVDSILIRVIRDEDKAFNLFLLGELDLFGMSAYPKYWYDRADAPSIRNGYIQRIQFYNDIPRYPYGLYLNRAIPPLDDLNIRLGIHYATDWQRVIDSYFRGDYERLQSFNQGFGRYSNTDVRAREFDPSKAREYFAKAGYSLAGRDGILTNARGDRLSFKLTMDKGEDEKILATLVDSARKVGLEFVPEALDSTTCFNKTQEKKHEIVFTAWGVNGLFPTFWEFFHKENAIDEKGLRKRQTNNITSTVDDKLSVLIDQHKSATTYEDMERLSRQIIADLHEEASFVPGYYRPWIRTGAWRWVKFPEGFAKRISETSLDYAMYWIDADLKAETEEAMKTRRTFPSVLLEYDQYRQD